MDRRVRAKVERLPARGGKGSGRSPAEALNWRVTEKGRYRLARFLRLFQGRSKANLAIRLRKYAAATLLGLRVLHLSGV